MRSLRRSMLIPLLLAAAVVVDCAPGGDACPQCGRAECRNLTFGVHLATGKVVRTCCARCALRYLSGPHPPVASLSVRDFGTAARLDATSAIYVEGSDVSPCTELAESAPRDERGCCMKTVYDRCLPSLVAFASREKAETFASSHGGVLKTFAELQTSTP